MSTYTLISAAVGDQVGIGIELAEAADEERGIISASDLRRLAELPEVVAFFEANHFGEDGHEDELMYLVQGEHESVRYDTLTVTLEDEPLGVEVVNCTPHNITVGGVTIAPSGIVPRLAQSSAVVDTLRLADGQEIPVVETAMGELTGLPDTKPGTYLVVSRLVAEAAPDRADLLIPGKAVRDAEGNVVGCETLARLPRQVASTHGAKVTVRMRPSFLYELAHVGLAERRRLAKRLVELPEGIHAEAEAEALERDIWMLSGAIGGIATQVLDQLAWPTDYPPTAMHRGNWQRVLDERNS